MTLINQFTNISITVFATLLVILISNKYEIHHKWSEARFWAIKACFTVLASYAFYRIFDGEPVLTTSYLFIKIYTAFMMVVFYIYFQSVLKDYKSHKHNIKAN